MDFVRWFALGFAAITKIFPLPLVLVPFLWTAGIDPKKMRQERLGVVAGVIFTLALPILFEGMAGTASLYGGWKQALASRGLPIESHNQSFAAFLIHYTSGHPIPVLAQARAMHFGAALFSSETIALLSLAWIVFFLGMLSVLILIPSAGTPLRKSICLTGGVFLPSHLVWKPYFVMTYPLAALFLRDITEKNAKSRVGVALVLAALLNLTSFDVVGPIWAARFEAASLFLWVHLALLTSVCGSQ